MPDRPSSALCFVLMPFGRKRNPQGGPEIDFDRIYQEGIRPAIERAGLEPIRADAEIEGGIIHKAMFERLLLCDYAIADLTTANPNVFYELGVRHTSRPRSTVAIYAEKHSVPFDLNYLRHLPYDLDGESQLGEAQAEALRDTLTEKLRLCREESRDPDSPLFQLLREYRPPDLAHMATDTFRDRARYSETLRQRMAGARRKGSSEARIALRDLADEMLTGTHVEFASLVDLYLSYRAVEAWQEMIELYEKLPPELRRTVRIREQLAFAHGRRQQPGDSERALELLEAIEAESGSNPETSGLIGRVHKDRWRTARDAGDAVAAGGHLDAAIDAYRRGFETDWRDFYPGINLLTLLHMRGDEGDAELCQRLAPVVRYAVDRQVDTRPPDYWELATQLELSVLSGDQRAAQKDLRRTIAAIREVWEPKTTADNLETIAQAGEERGEPTEWIRQLIAELRKDR